MWHKSNESQFALFVGGDRNTENNVILHHFYWKQNGDKLRNTNGTFLHWVKDILLWKFKVKPGRGRNPATQSGHTVGWSRPLWSVAPDEVWSLPLLTLPLWHYHKQTHRTIWKVNRWRPELTMTMTDQSEQSSFLFSAHIAVTLFSAGTKIQLFSREPMLTSVVTMLALKLRTTFPIYMG